MICNSDFPDCCELSDVISSLYYKSSFFLPGFIRVRNIALALWCSSCPDIGGRRMKIYISTYLDS